MRPVLLLAAAAAFMSMASAFVIKTYADALFLAEYGAAFVPHFMVGQALLLVGVSYGYGFLIRTGKTLLFDTVILTALISFAVVAPLLARRGGVWVFAVALGLVVGSALGQMAIWNAATSVVSGRAARAFLPRAGAAATAGAVVGGFGSSALVGVFSLSVLAPTAGALTLIALALRFFLRSGAVVKRVSARMSVPPVSESDQSSVARLVTMLAAATVVEALLSAVVDFGFKREVEHSFDGNVERMGLFLSLFYGTSNILLLGVQLFAASRLLATRSLKFSLGVQPVAQSVASVLWAISPLLPLAAISRGLENVFKFGIARPAQEVALTPLREAERKRWKVLLRGVFAQGGALVAGLLLIASAPLLAWHPSVVPAIAALLALAWVIFQRRTADGYRQALGTALGLRRRLGDHDSAPPVTRDSLHQVLELAGDEDHNAARLARELIDELASDSRLLRPHIGKGPAEARRAVYRVLAARPDRSCAISLRDAVLAEPDDSPALADGLVALAAHNRGGAEDRARALCAGSEPDVDREPAASAWLYLAALGAADRDHRDRVVGGWLHRDGRRAAELLAALERGGVLDAGAIAERVVAAVDDAPDVGAAREALYVTARIGHPAGLGRLLRALEAGMPGAGPAIAQLGEEGLHRLAQAITDQPVSERTRARFLRALRGLDMPEVTAVAAPYLLDPDAEVRAMAAHTLYSQTRRGHPRPPGRILAQALDDQLDRFELYVRARPGTIIHDRESAISLQLRKFAKGEVSQEAFFLDELDRRTERSLGRVADLLALIGDSSTVYAAERALKSPSFKRRRQALDLLQEIVSGRQRVRLLELLDAYLLPRSEASQQARKRVCELDPWLARCLISKGDQSRKLWALRGAELFDAVPGEAIERLVGHCEIVTYAEEDPIVTEGEPGDALYVVMDGAVAVERGGKLVTNLGAGEAFGELALIDDNPRGATVRVIQDCTVLRLPAVPFRQALDRYPELGLGLVRGLVGMLRGKLR